MPRKATSGAAQTEEDRLFLKLLAEMREAHGYTRDDILEARRRRLVNSVRTDRTDADAVVNSVDPEFIYTRDVADKEIVRKSVNTERLNRIAAGSLPTEVEVRAIPIDHGVKETEQESIDLVAAGIALIAKRAEKPEATTPVAETTPVVAPAAGESKSEVHRLLTEMIRECRFQKNGGIISRRKPGQDPPPGSKSLTVSNISGKYGFSWDNYCAMLLNGNRPSVEKTLNAREPAATVTKEREALERLMGECLPATDDERKAVRAAYKSWLVESGATAELMAACYPEDSAPAAGAAATPEDLRKPRPETRGDYSSAAQKKKGGLPGRPD